MGAVREVSVTGDNKKKYTTYQFICDVCKGEISGPSQKGVLVSAQNHVNQKGHKQSA